MIQIIQRRKDSWEWGTQHRVIKEYFIYSMDSLENKYEEMKKLCITFNARAYIRLSRRNCETMAKKMIIDLWNAFKNNSFKHLRKIYSSVVGRDIWLDKIWIIDIDTYMLPPNITRDIDSLRPIWTKLITGIPTVSWWHLITKPFDLNEFKKIYPTIDVHKNNPTLLYYVINEKTKKENKKQIS